MFRTNTIVEVVERGRQGERGERGQDGSITYWNPLLQYIDVNTKVEYEGNIYNLHNAPSVVGLPPNFNFDFWRPITGSSGNFTPNLDADVEDGHTLIFDEASGSWINGFTDSKDVVYNVPEQAGERMLGNELIPSSEVTNRLTDKVNVKEYLDDLTFNSSGVVMRHRVQAERYNPFKMKGWSNFQYALAGVTRRHNIFTNNEDGSYNIQLRATEDVAFTEGAAIYIGEPPEDGVPLLEFVNIIQRAPSGTQGILAAPLKWGIEPKEQIPNDTPIYIVTADFDQFLNDGAEFVGHGWIGYPFPLEYISQSGFALYNGEDWEWLLNHKSPDNYGCSFNFTGIERPFSLCRVSDTDPRALMTSVGFDFSVNGFKYSVPAYTDIMRIPLRSSRVQHIYLCPNTDFYNINQIFGAYSIENHLGTSFDFISLQSNYSDDNPLPATLNSFIPLCRVTMDEDGLITSIVDTLWLASNGSFENLVASFPTVVSGMELINNGFNDPVSGASTYTITEAVISTTYKNVVRFPFAFDPVLLKVWQGLDVEFVNNISPDGLYRRVEAGEVTKEPIPVGFFAVDLLYCYENPNMHGGLKLMKGSQLFTIEDLAMGVNLPLREVKDLLLIGILVQGNSTVFTDYLKVVNVRGSELTQPVSIFTREYVDEILTGIDGGLLPPNAETATSYIYDGNVGGYLQASGNLTNVVEHITEQGWEYTPNGESLSIVQDFATLDYRLFMRRENSVNHQDITMKQDISRDIQNIVTHGGTVVYELDVGMGEAILGFGWDNGFTGELLPEPEPDNTTRLYKFPEENVGTFAALPQLGFRLASGFEIRTRLMDVVLDAPFAIFGNFNRSTGFVGMWMNATNGLMLDATEVGTLVAGTNDITIIESAGNVTVTINGVETVTAFTPSVKVVNAIGVMFNEDLELMYGRNYAIANLSVKLGVDIPLLVFNMRTRTNQFTSSDPNITATFLGYLESDWVSYSLEDAGEAFTGGGELPLPEPEPEPEPEPTDVVQLYKFPLETHNTFVSLGKSYTLGAGFEIRFRLHDVVLGTAFSILGHHQNSVGFVGVWMNTDNTLRINATHTFGQLVAGTNDIVLREVNGSISCSINSVETTVEGGFGEKPFTSFGVLINTIGGLMYGRGYAASSLSIKVDTETPAITYNVRTGTGNWTSSDEAVNASILSFNEANLTEYAIADIDGDVVVPEPEPEPVEVSLYKLPLDNASHFIAIDANNDFIFADGFEIDITLEDFPLGVNNGICGSSSRSLGYSGLWVNTDGALWWESSVFLGTMVEGHNTISLRGVNGNIVANVNGVSRTSEAVYSGNTVNALGTMVTTLQVALWGKGFAFSKVVMKADTDSPRIVFNTRTGTNQFTIEGSEAVAAIHGYNETQWTTYLIDAENPTRRIRKQSRDLLETFEDLLEDVEDGGAVAPDGEQLLAKPKLYKFPQGNANMFFALSQQLRFGEGFEINFTLTDVVLGAASAILGNSTTVVGFTGVWMNSLGILMLNNLEIGNMVAGTNKVRIKHFEGNIITTVNGVETVVAGEFGDKPINAIGVMINEENRNTYAQGYAFKGLNIRLREGLAPYIFDMSTGTNAITASRTGHVEVRGTIMGYSSRNWQEVTYPVSNVIKVRHIDGLTNVVAIASDGLEIDAGSFQGAVRIIQNFNPATQEGNFGTCTLSVGLAGEDGSIPARLRSYNWVNLSQNVGNNFFLNANGIRSSRDVPVDGNVFVMLKKIELLPYNLDSNIQLTAEDFYNDSPIILGGDRSFNVMLPVNDARMPNYAVKDVHLYCKESQQMGIFATSEKSLIEGAREYHELLITEEKSHYRLEAKRRGLFMYYSLISTKQSIWN